MEIIENKAKELANNFFSIELAFDNFKNTEKKIINKNQGNDYNCNYSELLKKYIRLKKYLHAQRKLYEECIIDEFPNYSLLIDVKNQMQNI